MQNRFEKLPRAASHFQHGLAADRPKRCNVSQRTPRSATLAAYA
jgi:hypothetical protein